jgi:hypothetical protein
MNTLQNGPSQGRSARAFESHPERVDAVRNAMIAIRRLLLGMPGFKDGLRAASRTEEGRKDREKYRVEISAEVLWRHRGYWLSMSTPCQQTQPCLGGLLFRGRPWQGMRLTLTLSGKLYFLA